MKRKYSGDSDQPNYKRPRLANQNIERAIAKAFICGNYQSFNSLANDLPGSLSMTAAELLIRELALLLKKNNRLSSAIKGQLSRLANSALTSLVDYLEGASNPNSEFSAWLTSKSLNAQGQTLAFLIYNSGQIAEHLVEMQSISASSLKILLSKLANNPHVTSKAIANGLYGLGLLTKTKKISDAIELSLVQDLFKKLANLPDLASQGITNSLYSLGLLAKAGNLHGMIEASIMQTLLMRLANLHDLDSQQTGNSLHGLGLLAAAGKLRGRIEASILQTMLKRLVNLHDLDSQATGNSLYGLGLLTQAEKLQGAIESSILQTLLNRLIKLPDLSCQAISNSLYGLGLLADADLLHGLIEGSTLQAMLKQLANRQDLHGQDAGLSLYSLGLLATAGKIYGSVETSTLQILLTRFANLENLNSQNVGNSLHGLGLLAKADKLHGVIEAANLQVLLKQLVNFRDLDSQTVSLSLYCLGQLARADKLHGVIEAANLQVLLKQLVNLRDLSSQSVSLSLHGLGLLAKADMLHGIIKSPILQVLLKRMANLGDSSYQHVGNSLYGLGLLAKANKLHEIIEASILQDLLKRLSHSEYLDGQTVSQSLYGLGLLADTGKLHDVIKASILQDLLNRLVNLQDLNHQTVSNSLYGLGLLARADKLHGVIEASILQDLLNRLHHSEYLDCQAISVSLYSLGLLADAGKLHGVIEASILQALFSQLLLRQEVESQKVANSLNGLGVLALTGKLKGSLDICLIEKSLAKLQSIHPSPLDARLALSALSILSASLTEPFSKTGLVHIKTLLARSLQVPYLHPSLAAELINAMVALKTYSDKAMSPIFAKAVAALSLPLTAFPSRLQKQLKANLLALTAQPECHKRLARQLGLSPAPERLISQAAVPMAHPESQARARTALPRQTPTINTTALFSSRATGSSEHFTKACKNGVFNAIAKKDEQGLRKILQLVNEMLAASGRQPGRQGVPRPPAEGVAKRAVHNAEQIVLAFFEEIDAKALQELISQSQSHYFVLLLQACSAHTRFQLAQSNTLHPIILHLPFEELKKFVKKLTSPFQIYRDHQALLHVIDALIIRLAKARSQEQADLKTMQLSLLEEGLTFHEQCKHHHVVGRLQSTKTTLEQNQLSLLDLAKDDSSVSQPAVSKPAAAAAHQSPASKPRAAQKKSQPEDYNLYEYETEDIQAILVARVKDYPQVSVLASAQMNEAIEGNGVVEVLADFLVSRHVELSDGQPRQLLLPIQDGGHWLGLLVRLQGEQIQSLHYYNSLQQNEGDLLRMAKIQNLLQQEKLITAAIKVSPAPIVMQQADGSSCGVLLVENFYCTLKNRWWPYDNNQTVSQADTKLMRHRHLAVLKEQRLDFYKTFEQRQANNLISVPDLAVQLQSHGLFAIPASQQESVNVNDPLTQTRSLNIS